MATVTRTEPLGDAVLEMNGVSKTFGVYRALDDFSLTLRRGEVHCLAGENGSGKSTAIKILSGVLARDSGGIRLFSQDLGSNEVQRVIDLGLSVIYQDLSLLPNLSVAENIGMPASSRKGGRLARWKEWRRVAQETFDLMGLSIDLDAMVETLPIAERQLVAIARAIATDALVIVMDEPTTALTRSEVERLFRLVNTLKQKGVSFLFVSHKFEEIFEICDSITVLRDGKIVATGDTSSFDRQSLAVAMTGRSIVDERLAGELAEDAPIRLSIQALSRAPDFLDVSLELRAGEILSIVGLLGAGQRELALCLFGLLKPDSGVVTINGMSLPQGSTRIAMANGLAFLPDDRLSDGLFLERSIADNISAASLESFTSAFGWLKKGALRRAVRSLAESLRIKAAGIDWSADSLSGGNQQRVMLARLLMRSPGVLILNSPTVGVDIASKRDIHDILIQLSRSGTSILVIADDLAEVLAISHRILVMKGGSIVRELNPLDVGEHELGLAVASDARPS